MARSYECIESVAIKSELGWKSPQYEHNNFAVFLIIYKSLNLDCNAQKVVDLNLYGQRR